MEVGISISVDFVYKINSDRIERTKIKPTTNKERTVIYGKNKSSSQSPTRD